MVCRESSLVKLYEKYRTGFDSLICFSLIREKWERWDHVVNLANLEARCVYFI